MDPSGNSGIGGNRRLYNGRIPDNPHMPGGVFPAGMVSGTNHKLGASDDYVYDVESFRNFFCCGFRRPTDPPEIGYIFEISERRNQAYELVAFLSRCRRLIGFNNFLYDWVMIDHFLRLMSAGIVPTAEEMRRKSDQIVGTPWPRRYDNAIWNPSIPQIDMFLMLHLDRAGVGLKQTEFTLRRRRVCDMPFDVNAWLTPQQMDEALVYNAEDISSTGELFIECQGDVKLRESFGPEWLNYNDGKLGSKFFERELQAAGVRLYERERYGGRRRPRQTPRPDGVRLADVVLPFIRFVRPDLMLKLEEIRDTKIEEGGTRGGLEVPFYFQDMEVLVKLGGIHGSAKRRAIHAGSHRLLDVDVTGYYPNIAIVHGVYPEHLGPKFCEIYRRLRDQRNALPKSDPARTALKFACNVPFGQSNEPNGIFYDPKYFLTITMNGQLMLCMLAEQLALAPDVELLQVNTDGLTIRFPPSSDEIVQRIIDWWSRLTGMPLDKVSYNRMFIRDANAYLAETAKGERKRVGPYDWTKTKNGKPWQMDHSQLVVAKTAEAVMLDGAEAETFVDRHENAWDFLLFRKGRMELTTGEAVPRNLRYYVSLNGNGLVALYPPRRAGGDPHRVGVHAAGQATAVGKRKQWLCSVCGQPFASKSAFNEHNRREHSWKITPANEFDGRVPNDIDKRYYLEEAERLIIR